MCTPSRWGKGTLETLASIERVGQMVPCGDSNREKTTRTNGPASRALRCLRVCGLRRTRDVEKACYEEQASSFFQYIQYSHPDQPDWDLKSSLSWNAVDLGHAGLQQAESPMA